MITIYRPVKTNFLTQDFGESRVCIDRNDKIVGKIDGVCPPNTQNLYRSMGMLGHNGRDWLCYFQEPVYFSVTFAGWLKSEVDDKGGIGVDVISNQPILQCNEPNCNQTHYVKQRLWHNDKITGYDGLIIKIGQQVSLGDSTGLSGGNHVHESLKWCDEKGNGLHQDNGYYGAINIYKHPDIVVDNRFVLDALNLQQQLTTIQQLLSLYLQLIQAIIKIKTKVGGIFKKNEKLV